MKCLITGGAGFVGSSIAIKMKEKHPGRRVVCLDNLKRRGSELNISRLQEKNIEFIHGDIRNKEDIENIGKIDVIIECSAEPSVLAGFNSSPEYLINTNLLGTVNCLELARKSKAGLIFLSTSRVYPIKTLNSLKFIETDTRFELLDGQDVPGAGSKGYTEDFPLNGIRSLYGATKLASELIIQEYINMYGLKAVINRCGIITGPWQFGKIDQGVVALWVASHYWKRRLQYIGYGAEGKQVRDILHIDDFFNLIEIELEGIDSFTGETFNVGGGKEISISLKELTQLSEKYTGNKITIDKVFDERDADIRIYLTDNSKIMRASGWKPEKSADVIINDIYQWIKQNDDFLFPVLK